MQLAPWMGGFYERMVGVVKSSLRKVLGRLLLTFDQLSTLIVEVEAAVNSGPLVYVSSDILSSFTLTPNHFLSLNPFVGGPPSVDRRLVDEMAVKSNAKELLNKWKKGQEHLNSFSRVWKG